MNLQSRAQPLKSLVYEWYRWYMEESRKVGSVTNERPQRSSRCILSHITVSVVLFILVVFRYMFSAFTAGSVLAIRRATLL